MTSMTTSQLKTNAKTSATSASVRFIGALAKWLFVIPFAIFGLLHFGPLEFSMPYVPAWLPAPTFWIYFLGVCLIAFSVSAIIRRLDGLAALLLAGLMFTFILFVHIPTAANGDFAGLISIMRDTAMAGAALLYAVYVAKDKRFTELKN